METDILQEKGRQIKGVTTFSEKHKPLYAFTTGRTICDGLVVTRLQPFKNLQMVDSRNTLEPRDSLDANPADGCSGQCLMKVRFMKLLAYYMDARGGMIYFPLLNHAIFLVFIR